MECESNQTVSKDCVAEDNGDQDCEPMHSDDNAIHSDGHDADQTDPSQSGENANRTNHVNTSDIGATPNDGPENHKEISSSDNKQGRSRGSKFYCSICQKNFLRKNAMTSHMKMHVRDDPEKYKTSEHYVNGDSQPSKRHQCTICDKSFSRVDSLEGHMNWHNGVTPYKCNLCDKTFTHRGALRLHTEGHMNQYSCDICGKTFNRKGTLDRHRKTHDEEKTFKCDVCDKAFHLESHLKLHKNTHLEVKPHTCNICDKGFSTPESLKYHMSQHTGFKPYQCEICEASFVRSSTLNRHMMSHSNEGGFECDVCAKRFASKLLLDKHKASHGQNTNASEICNRSTSTEENLETQPSTRKANKTFHCEICQKDFAQAHSLKAHMLTHSGFQRFSCNLCDKSFSRKDTLAKHKLVHEGTKDFFKCTLCKSSFTELKNLKKHMKTHTIINPYQCTVCEEEFSSPKALKDHQKTHPKPFKCEFCQKLFARFDSLTDHLTIHTGDMPYVCSICDKTFPRKGALKNHELIHSDEMDHHCEVCFKEFTQKVELDAHIQNAHAQHKHRVCDERSQTPRKWNVQDLFLGKDHSYEVRGQIFRKKGNFKVHERTRDIKLGSYSCKLCNRKFKLAAQLGNHMRSHKKGSPYQIIKCDVCSEGFYQEDALEEHMLHHDIKVIAPEESLQDSELSAGNSKNFDVMASNCKSDVSAVSEMLLAYQEDAEVKPSFETASGVKDVKVEIVKCDTKEEFSEMKLAIDGNNCSGVIKSDDSTDHADCAIKLEPSDDSNQTI